MIRRAKCLLLLGLITVAWGASFSAPSHAAPATGNYQLGPQDRVRLKVYEWRPSRDDFYEWKALNDTFIIGPDGTLSLPFAGTLMAAGLTPEQLEKVVGDQLKKQMNLVAAPDTSVEIVQFRPVYVTGYVMRPGEYAYRPNLTVLQAISIAGGLRVADRDDTRLGREMIISEGDVDVMKLGALGLLARKARLQAEFANADHIEFPPQLTRLQDQSVKRILAQEEAIFQTRRYGLSTQIEALKNLSVSLRDEVSSLQGQLGFNEKQISLIQKELTSVSSLVTKGYAAAPRELSLEREVAQFQSARLETETGILRARQEISRNDIQILDVQNRYKNDVTVSLRDTQSQLDELARKTDTSERLIRESETYGTRLLSLRDKARERKPIYTILRSNKEGGSADVTVQEDTPVQPGDTIKVTMPPLAGEDDIGLPLAGAADYGISALPRASEGKLAQSTN